MNITEATKIVTACAESDYDGTETAPADSVIRELLDLWANGGSTVHYSEAEVAQAIQTLGDPLAVRVYREALQDAHEAEYDLGGEDA